MNRLTLSIFIALIAGLFFIPFLGGVRLFDWDEINFAEISREMLVLDDYLRVHVDFKPFFEKPPFFFWLQATAMSVFGVGEFAARLPNALCGIITLIVLFNLGTQLYDRRFGLIWAGTYIGSILPHLYFRSGIIDPWFNLWIFIGLNGLIFFRWKKDGFDIFLPRSAWHYLVLGGLLLGMGIITKGPVAYLIVCLTLGVYFLLNRFKLFINPLHFIVYSLLATVVTLLWYGVETYLHGPKFIQEFIRYNYRLFSTPDAGHSGFPGYHFVLLFVGCFPASTFAIRAFWPTAQEHTYQQDYKKWMVILFWVVLILFSIVKSKIVHYSSMCYFPLTYLATLAIYQLWERKISLNTWMRAGLWVTGGAFIAATLLLPVLAFHKEWLRPFVAEDPFAAANIEAKISWTGWEVMPGILLFISLVVALRLLTRHDYLRGLVTLFGGTALFVTFTLWFFIGRIEGVSQAAAMRFFEARQGEDCYVHAHGYRTYGEFFYTHRQPAATARDENWLFYGPVDKPVYVITKNTLQQEIDTVRTLRKLGEENGFVFYKRIPPVAPTP